mmetsp:Transcript_11903/g.27631  ORF Transcript_11903/g.27631 Transcript_11903/m.27631 type:complete len:201 (+) Transcript_11903:23-625(+)
MARNITARRRSKSLARPRPSHGRWHVPASSSLAGCIPAPYSGHPEQNTCENAMREKPPPGHASHRRTARISTREWSLVWQLRANMRANAGVSSVLLPVRVHCAILFGLGATLRLSCTHSDCCRLPIRGYMRQTSRRQYGCRSTHRCPNRYYSMTSSASRKSRCQRPSTVSKKPHSERGAKYEVCCDQVARAWRRGGGGIT